jgi:hypothetical protein
MRLVSLLQGKLEDRYNLEQTSEVDKHLVAIRAYQRGLVLHLHNHDNNLWIRVYALISKSYI